MDDTAGTRTLLGDQRKGVVALAIPIGVALFFQQLNSIVDSLWVAGLGGSAMSALGIVYPIYTILIGIGNGLGIGVGAAIARNIGQRNHVDANRSAAQGVVITAVVSLILTPILLLTAEQTMVLMGAGDTVQDCLAYAHPIYLMMFFIILSGSSMSFMEEGVLSEKSPLYGRRTGQIRLQPFDYLECAQWFPSFSTEDKAFLYGITGGVPYYMECFTKAGSIREAVIESVLSPNGLLYEEPSFLLREELRDSFIYDSLIRAIAEGRTRMSEISSALGIETGMCSTYMKSLIELGFVRKETPVGKNGGRRTLYRIDDFFLLFWFRFVYRFSSSIASGRGEDVYDRIICSEINEYMGLVFERMVRDFILKYAATPFLIGQIGRWHALPDRPDRTMVGRKSQNTQRSGD